MDVTEMAKYREHTVETESIRPEVLDCLIDGLKFLNSDAAIPAQKLAKRILANIIIEHLDISGFSIHRKEICEATIPTVKTNVYSLVATSV